MSFAESIKSLNKYTTSLHSVNSSIIKLSKLTKAKKVYRGVSGGILPDVCRMPNSYGVRGGVEGARSIGIRAFITRDFMTGTPAMPGTPELPLEALAEIQSRVLGVKAIGRHVQRRRRQAHPSWSL